MNNIWNNTDLCIWIYRFFSIVPCLYLKWLRKKISFSILKCLETHLIFKMATPLTKYLKVLNVINFLIFYPILIKFASNTWSDKIFHSRHSLFQPCFYFRNGSFFLHGRSSWPFGPDGLEKIKGVKTTVTKYKSVSKLEVANMRQIKHKRKIIHGQ